MMKLVRTLGPRLLQQLQPKAKASFRHQTACAGENLSRGFCTQSVDKGLDSHTDGVFMRTPREDIPYSVKGLSHIAIAVPDLISAAEHYKRAYGAQISKPVEKKDQGVTVIFVQFLNLCIELIHPLGEKSPVAKFLQKNPRGGIHHICMAVDDITSAAQYLSNEIGVGTVGNSVATTGAEGKPILFLNPKDNHGVLIELQQGNQPLVTGNEDLQAVSL